MVNATDVRMVLSAWLSILGSKEDIDENSKVGSLDLAYVIRDFWKVVATPTPTPTSIPTSPASFSVGSGGADVISHQIVRTGRDFVYIFTMRQYSSAIRAFWTTSPGLPQESAAFNGSTQLSVSANPISLDAPYDGGNFIHLLVNAQDGSLKDYPYDLTSNTFKPAITLVASGNPTVPGDYLGSAGVSGMFDKGGVLNVVYWSNGNHITYKSYTYDSSANVLTQNSTTQLDSGGSANHPVIAVSPSDNSLTVAWVSQATNPPKILARTRSSSGTWGSIENVSAAAVWTSTYFGINIDQGPSLIINSDGTKHLTYIENFDSTGDYGRIHYVINSGLGWLDSTLTSYTHDPALAVNGSGDIYIIGHGHPKSQNTVCTSLDDICTIKKNTNGTWNAPQIFRQHSSGTSLDTSPSVKWSAIGFNRPQTIEFLITSIPVGDYSNPTIYYAHM